MGRRLFYRIALIAGLLAIALIGGAIGFRVIEGYPWPDAFYMTLITISTVGYQELHPLSPAGRLFNSFLILFGVSVMFFSVGAITQTVIELELQDRFRKRRTKRLIDGMRDHFIVCGFGRVGRNASLELQRAGANFVVVDRSEAKIEAAAQAGMTGLLADSTHDESLRAAGIARAKGL